MRAADIQIDTTAHKKVLIPLGFMAPTLEMRCFRILEDRGAHDAGIINARYRSIERTVTSHTQTVSAQTT